jgi:hypothetical protein
MSTPERPGRGDAPRERRRERPRGERRKQAISTGTALTETLRSGSDRRRSPEDVREPVPEDADFPDYDDAFLAMVNDMDVVPEDVRGADVEEPVTVARLALQRLHGLALMGAEDDGTEAAANHAAQTLRAVLRSPEPAAEPVEALEIAWGIIANAYGGNWDLATEEWREAAIRWRDEHWHPRLPAADPSIEPGGEPRYTLAEVADILEAEAEECRAADGEVSALEGWRDASRWLRHEGTCGGPVYRRPDTLAEVADLIERREYGPGIGEEGLAIARWLRSGGATTEMGGDDQ